MNLESLFTPQKTKTKKTKKTKIHYSQIKANEKIPTMKKEFKQPIM